ncbi:hypothetical protein [Micromonospora fulviviridis]|nr:hypothetical protein [Micromonospora fulviviridis]
MKTEYEVVPPPGMVDLNRTNRPVLACPQQAAGPHRNDPLTTLL